VLDDVSQKGSGAGAAKLTTNQLWLQLKFKNSSGSC